MKKRLFLAVLVVCLIAATAPAVALAAGEPTVKFEDVTATRSNTLEGEAKIKVSISGYTGQAIIAQLQLEYASSNMKYKSIEWPSNNWTVKNPPNIANANQEKKFMVAVISPSNPITLNGDTEICTLTFEGNKGDSVNLSLINSDASYISPTLSQQINITQPAQQAATGSSTSNKGVNITVKLTLPDVSDFAYLAGSGEIDSGIFLTMTNKANGMIIYSTLDKRAITEGGNRDTTQTTPTFTFSQKNLLQGQYDVELRGRGFTTAKLDNQDCSSTKTINITTSTFKPGDVNGDGVIDIVDYTCIMSAVKNGSDSDDLKNLFDYMDFNRDNKVDLYDLRSMKSSLAKEGQ